MKPLLLITGLLAAILIVIQLVLGLLILQGRAKMRTAHQHSGYLTVAVTLLYIGWSMAVIASPAPQNRRIEEAVERSFHGEDRLEIPIGGELGDEEPRGGLVAEEGAGAGGPRLR